MKTYKELKNLINKTIKKASQDVWKDSPLPSFKSSFSEHSKKDRSSSNKKVDEAFVPFTKKFIKHSPGAWDEHIEPGEEYKSVIGDHGVEYNIHHNHPDVRANKLEPHHIQAINRYCTVGSDKHGGYGSSANMNAMLRNMSGDKSSRVLYHDPEHVKASIHALSSAFTPENTNRAEMKTWGGIE